MRGNSHILFAICLVITLSTPIYAQVNNGIELVRVLGVDENAIRSFYARGFDIIEAKPGGFVEMIAFPRDKKLLKNLGYSFVSITPDRGRYLKEPAPSYKTGGLQIGVGRLGGYFSLDNIFIFLDSLQAQHPDILTTGASIGTTLNARSLLVYKISDNPYVDEIEPEVLYDGMTHAREPGGTTGILYFMEWLLNGYNADDPEAIYLVENRELYFLPVLNPDGYAVNDSSWPNLIGYWGWRKNVRDNNNDNIFTPVADGVDLNRNFPYKWNYDNYGSSPNDSDATYRGTAPASEPEIAALVSFVESRNFIAAFNYHTFGDLLIWPWGYLDGETPDSIRFREAAIDLTRNNKYVFGAGGQTVRYVVNGNSDDYMYGVHGILSFTPEIGTKSDYFWPEQSRVLPLAKQVLFTNRHLAWIAGAFLDVIDYRIDDSIGGDGDGWLDPGESVDLTVSVRNKGLSINAADVSGTLTSTDPNVNIGSPLVSFGNIGSLTTAENAASPFSFSIDADVTPGDTIELLIEWQATTVGSYRSIDTLRIVAGSPVIIFYDDAENGTENWITTGNWETSDIYSVSGDNAFDDSPYIMQSASANSPLRLVHGLDLSSAEAAFVSFYTRYDIEQDYDAVVTEFSADGTMNWEYLSGQDTYPGVRGAQPQGFPVFSGYHDHFWLKQNMQLPRAWLAGATSARVRFRTLTDTWAEYDGFYFDDFLVGLYTTEEIAPVLLKPTRVKDTGEPGPYTVRAVASDNGNVDSLVVRWSADAGVSFVSSRMDVVEDYFYAGELPAQSLGTQLRYYYAAYDNAGQLTVAPEGAPAETYRFVYTDLPPYMSVQGDSVLYFAAGVQSEDTDTLTVRNDGGLPLEITVEVMTDEGSWLRVEPESALLYGGEEVELVVTASGSGLTPRTTYTGYVVLHSNDPDNDWVVVGVTFDVDVIIGTEEIAGLPEQYELYRNHPNPFNPATNIDYALPEASHVTMTVYNLLGEAVARLVDKEMPAGYHSVRWDASGIASGVYIYRLNAGSFNATRKMLLLK